MNRSIRLSAIPAIVFLTLGAAEGGCAKKAGGSGDCTVTEVRVSRGPGDRMSGVVQTKCKPAPKVHTATLSIQHQRIGSAKWDTINTNPADHRNPGTAGISYSILAPCSPGNWRLLLRIRGTASDGSAITVDSTSATKYVKNC